MILLSHDASVFIRMREVIPSAKEPKWFKLHSEYMSTGDQPQAIKELIKVHNKIFCAVASYFWIRWGV